MITKAQNSSGCESKVYNITPESCFDKRVEDFRIKEIEFNPITKKLVIKQSPDVIISTDILQLNDVSEPTHLSPVEDIVDNIPGSAKDGISYILRVGDKYYHCTWRNTLKYWDRVQLKDGYEFFNKKDSTEYRYNDGALVDISTIHLSMKINPDNIQILNSSGDGVTLPVATQTTPGLFSKEDKTKLDSITKYVKEISFSGADTLVLDIVSSDGTKSLPIREANINQNGLMSKEACLNLSRLLNTVTNNIYTKEEVQELLNKKVDVAPGKDLLDTSQIFKINQIFNYVENVEYSENNNRASLKITTKDPTIGESSSKILSFPDVSSAISGLMSPKYKDYIDSLKSYYTGDPTKEYTGQDLQIIFPIYDPISKKVTSKYLVLDAATSSTAGLITAMEKNKLGNISSIVQAVSDNTYNSNSVILNLVTNNPQTGVEEPVQIVFKSATSEKAGVMSSSDKGKLDNVVKYLTDLIDTDTTSATQAIIHYQSYNPFLNTYEDKYYSLPMATSTIAGSITSTDFNVIQGLKDVNGTPLTYEGTPSKTWKVGDQILKNEKEGFSVRNEDDTEYGDLIVRNLTIKEDIVFGGSAFIIDTEEVKVTDNILTLNSGEQGEGVTKGISGLEIDRGKLPNYFIIFDESDDRFKCGTEGNQFPLMLRDNEPDMVDGAFLTWNSTFKRAQTTSTVPIQLALRFALQNLSEKDTDLIFKRVDNDLYLQYGDTNDKYLSLRVLDDILFKSSPSATKYVFDKEIWAPAFKRDDGYESAYLDKDIEDRKFLQYDSSKKLIHSSNTVYSDKGGLDFVDNIDDTNCIKLISNSKTFGIINYENFTSIEDSQPYWSFIISPRNTLTRDVIKTSILDIYTATHDAFGFTNPLILDYVKSYIGFGDYNHKFYGDAASFTFDVSGDIIQFIPSSDRSLINTKSSELGFSASIIIPTGLRSSDLSQIVFANYANLSKKYLSWDSSTNAITSIDGFDSLVVVNPNDPNKKLTLHYVNGGFSISSSSNVPDIEQNTIEITETIGSDGSVTYNLNSTYTPLHVNFPMWGSFCDKDGKPFATVESLVGHYLPLSAGSTNALTGPLYFSPTSTLVNKTDTGENAWALFIGDSTNGTSLCLGSLGDLESVGDLRNTALLNINSSGNTHTIRLGYTDENGNIKAGIVTSGDNLSSQTVIHTIGNNDIKHYKNGAEYIIYDSSNLNVEELLQNYTLEGNIIGTPKTTRIKGTTIPSGSDFINNFRELIWGTNDSTTWIVPFRSNSADSGLGGAYAANLGWSLSDTHAYISVSYRNDLRSVIIGGGNEGKIKWFEQVAFKSDINKLSSKYYPYSGRGHMTIGADGRPILDNSNGILFNKTGGERIEGIYMGSNNHLVLGGSSSANVPIEIFNDLNITRIVDKSTKYSLLIFTNEGTEDTQITHIGAEHGTTRIRSGLFNLVHDRGGTLYTVFDGYNFSRNLDTISINSSFNHLPMMAAQIKSGNATTDRGYPIQEAGSLVVIPGTYHGSSQIYGTYSTNRWFVRGGSNSLEDPTAHTSWKELATTNHLSGYLPLTGGTLTGRLTVPRINTNYIESIDGNALVAYHQVGVDGVTNAQVGIGTVVDQMILRSSNTNLMHYKNGTQYTILDTSNIAALTIQFNGSTNTTYAPNAPKTVNITPAAIGAAASSHTHNYAASPSAGGPATYILDSGGGSNNIQLAYKGYGLTASTASHLVGIDKTLVNGCRVFRDITPSEVRTLIEAAPSSHTHTKSQITDFPSSMPASDVYAWAKASSKPSYSYSEVGAAAASHTHTTIQGTYTGSGGSQPPSYVTAGTLRANMMYYNMSGSPYCDWLMMDTYIGSDVPYVTMIGVTKTATPRAFIASGPKGNASTSSWVRKELATVDAIPTTMAWDNITGVPATATRWPSWSEITSKPITFNPSGHTHPLSGISDLQASWDALLKAAPSAYVTRWPSWSEVTSKPSFATVATSGSYNDLSNKPSIPSAETAATIMSKINSQSEITFTKHVVCSAGAGLQSTSDIRFKSNFNSLPDDTLNKVLNAPEFTYNWKDETTTSIGTSAQYWEDKIPELVHEMEDGTKTFSYERYTVVLQKALKEEHRLREEEKKRFKEEIDSLNTRLNDLTSLIQKLI